MNAPSMNAPSVNAPSGEPSPDKRTVQNAARETRYTLSDLMKQLHYESGDARINSEGYHTLDQLVEVVKAAPPEQLIRVEGHADSMEIGPSLKSMYPTNWDLSKARATGVLRYLVEKGGIDSARITSVGYGSTKPVVSNGTEAGRSKNRRVEVVLYSPDSAPSSAEPATAPAEAAADGYRVTGLGTEGKEPAGAPAEKPVPADVKNEEPQVVTPAVMPETPSGETASVPALPEKSAQP